MKIGLLDMDSHNFPNLALMKISAWHKKENDDVEFINHFKKYDRVYISKIYTYKEENRTAIDATEIIKGGTGYIFNNFLPDCIEHIYPDYSIYNEKRAIGFLTRGCPRNCPFCIVSTKEGKESKQVADVNEFWKDQKEIVFLDGNFLACKDHKRILKSLPKNVRIDFNQGLDIRLIDKENLMLLKELRLKTIRFSFDTEKIEQIFLQNISLVKSYFPLKNSIRIYILTNFNTEFEYDIYRVEKCKELEIDPYIMIYNKKGVEKKYIDLQRYSNNKWLLRSNKNFFEYLENYKGFAPELGLKIEEVK